MKKLFLFPFVILITVTASAQLEMNSSGEVGIGISPSTSMDLYTPKARINHLGVGANPYSSIDFYTPEGYIANLGVGVTPSSSYELNVCGESYFYASMAYSGFVFKQGSIYETNLIPLYNNTNQLGSSSYAFSYVYAYNLEELSDKRQKENIRELSTPLESVLKLQGVKYDIKMEYASCDAIPQDDSYRQKIDEARKNNIGFLAQDVFEIIPEVVTYNDSTDIYSIKYTRMIPYLVEAIKQQQEEINSLREEISILNKDAAYKSVPAVLTNPSDNLEIMSSLMQNQPNPFNETTTIRFVIADNTKQASLIIYDMSGKQVRSYVIADPSANELNIVGSALQSGMYMYSLIVDGELIGTKQMILTD